MKIIFLLMSERGHVNPFIGPAQALKLRGHDVLMTSIGDLSEQMEKSNLHFSNALIIPEVANNPRGKTLVDLVEDRARHRALIEQFFLKDIEKNVSPIQNFLKKELPDVVVIDPMHYAGVIAAMTLNLPWVGISSSLTSVLPPGFSSPITELVDTLAPDRKKVFQNFEVLPKFRAVDSLSPYLNISFSTEAFVGRPGENVKTVGPSLPLEARGDEVELNPLPKNKAIVYASFGSQVFHYPEIFKKIVAAAKFLPVHLVLSIGDLKLEAGCEYTESIHYYQYAPQLDLLKHTSVFITHGGANSVMEGLRAATPMLIHPICNDQFHQAYFIEKSGVGRSIDLKAASVEDIATALFDLLKNPLIRKRIDAVSATYQDNGAVKAAEMIEGLVANRKIDTRSTQLL